jgi:hypothetical protein
MTTPISGEQYMQKEINRRKFVCDLSKGAALAVLGSMTGCVHSIIFNINPIKTQSINT